MIVLIDGYAIDTAVDIQGATTTDCAGGRADISEVILPDAALADKWEIVRGMTLEIQDGGYSTGEMHIDEVEGKRNGTLVLRAISLAETSKEKKWTCFEYATLGMLLEAGAKALGLKAKMYGVRGDIQLRRVVQRGQTWPEFLAMVFRNEGATIKFEGDTIVAIDYQWAFSQDPVKVMRVEEKPHYIERPKFHSMRIRTGLLDGKATDTAVAGSAKKDIFNEQIYDMQQATRAAKGQLLDVNLNGEVYKTKIALDTAIAAMSRIDLFGHPRLAGNWFASSVTHDFREKSTALTLKRCITTIK